MDYVTTHLMEGLGNCLFMVANGMNYAHENGKKFYIDTKFMSHTVNRHCDFNIFSKLFKNIEFSDRNIEWNCFEGNPHHYEKIPNIDGNVKLRGFFKSFKYFDKDFVREQFSLDYNPKFQDYYSLHVRGGDYLKHRNVYNPLAETNYYKNALEIIHGKKCLVFTNDLKYCMEHLSKFGNLIFIDENNPYDSLIAMASCGGHIISNSTFAWWSAYLAKDSSTVIAPKNWFNPSLLFAEGSEFSKSEFLEDIYPSDWIVLE